MTVLLRLYHALKLLSFQAKFSLLKGGEEIPLLSEY